MSNDKSIVISDLAGLSKPLTKLIETVSCGLGKLYEPTHIKRMANAKATEMKLIAGEVQNNPLVPIKYKKGDVIVDGTDFSELAQRAQNRFVYQEMTKQQNIDSVISYASYALEAEEEVSSDPVDVDWTNRFFDSVASVSTEEMQMLWGKILAGEVKSPGSFSMRTLEIVRNLSRIEAELFLKIAPLIIDYSGKLPYISSDTTILNKYGISYDMVLQLDECGLVNSSGTLTLNLEVSKSRVSQHLTKSRLVRIQGSKEENSKISIDIHTLTFAGKELLKVLNFESNNDYILDVAQLIFDRNKRYAPIIIVNQLVDTDENTYTYIKTPIQTFGKMNL